MRRDIRIDLVIPALLGALACTPSTELPTGTSEAPLALGLAWSRTDARPGDTVAVRLVAEATTASPVSGVQGWIHFDAKRLTYLGQPLEGDVLALVNDSAAAEGTLRLLAIRQAGLSHQSSELVFVVRQEGYTARADVALEEAATQDLTVLTRMAPRPDTVFDSPRSTVPPRRLRAADWGTYMLQRIGGVAPRPMPHLAGEGLIYGDATLDGVINVLDVVGVANVSVGALPLLTAVNRDFVIAGNVAPFNLPGLGEAGDPIPPGREFDGSFLITVLDVVAIANASVGVTVPVVGQPIPGRQAASARVILAGTLAADRTLYADTVYELQGTVNVPGGVTLTIQPGTRIEGDRATRGALVIRRGGNILAAGTRLQPIVFTCTAAVKDRGCWGGIVINGFSLLNNGIVGAPGGEITGCPERVSIGNPGIYGGCLVEDTSGVLRYVRVEYGGMAPAGAGPAPGLALLGVGTGTVIDSVQVYGSLGDGIFLSGGTAQLRNVLASNNLGAGLHWADGWVGKGQYLVVQTDTINGPALSGENFVLQPDAAPRSAPTLYQVTVTGLPGGSGTGGGILLRNGSGLTLRDAIILSPNGPGLDIQGPESCALASGSTPSLLIENSIFFAGQPDYATDADCIDEAAYATDPARGNRNVDPMLLAPAFAREADLRPDPFSPALTATVAPPSDGFFDTTPAYAGAVAPANGSGSNIPWYPGWTRGWIPGAP